MNVRILNVDDNEPGRYAKTRILQRGGYEVIEAASGQTALDVVRENKPDLVLLDVKLPDISGYEVCRTIKREYPGVLVLQTSASFVQPGDRAHGLDSGADAYLTQPLEAAELIATVRALLRLRAAEQAARRSDELYRLIVDSASDYAIVTTDLDGVVNTWSGGAEKVLGYNAAEMLGQSIDRLFTADDVASGAIHADRKLALQQGRAASERWQVRKGGEQIWSNGVIVPLRNETELTGFIVIFRDRTAEKTHQDWLEREVRQRTGALVEANEKLRREIEERERAEEALRQAQKMEALGQLTGGIAHDFNNMLTVVLGSTEALKHRLPADAPDQHRRADLVLQAGTQAAALTHRLLAFSRQQPRDPKPTNINALIGGIYELLRTTVGESIEVRTDLADDLPPVLIDSNQLENAILNLVVNARDAMQGAGKLTVRTATAEPDWVILTVQDTGTGMTPEVLAKAFEPFFTTKRAGLGTGLGLAQVMRCAEQAGGTVSIDSAPGRGTTVEIRLPRLSSTLAIDEIVATARQGRFHANGRTALVVEDQEGVREYVAEALRQLDFKVTTAGDAKVAVAQLQANPKIELMVTDIGLPNGTDGWALASMARRMAPGIKMVLMTGYAHANAAPLGSGTELLMKPFTLPALETRLIRLFG